MDKIDLKNLTYEEIELLMYKSMVESTIPTFTYLLSTNNEKDKIIDSLKGRENNDNNRRNNKIN